MIPAGPSLAQLVADQGSACTEGHLKTVEIEGAGVPQDSSSVGDQVPSLVGTGRLQGLALKPAEPWVLGRHRMRFAYVVLNRWDPRVSHGFADRRNAGACLGTDAAEALDTWFVG